MTPVRRGFTLLEVVVSSMLLSIVVSAATALLFVTARSVPLDDDPGIAATETLRAFDMLEAELAYAIEMTATEPQRVDFVIRDRDADGATDQISYQWSGVAGDPWVRVVGNSRTGAVVRSVASLDMEYTRSEDTARLITVAVRVHPQGTRHALMTTTVRLINQPAAP